MKHDETNTISNSGAAVKQEDSLPYMLGSSIDQQEINQQALQDAGADVMTRAVVPDSQTENPQFLPQSSNPLAQGQGQVFDDKSQQCKKHTKTFCPVSMAIDETSSWLRRLESWESKSVFGYA